MTHMANTRRNIGMVVLLCALVPGVVVAAGLRNANADRRLSAAGEPVSSPVMTLVGAARYPEYGSLREIVHASTLVVRARALTGAHAYRIVPQHLRSHVPKKKAGTFGLIETEIPFQVQERIFGKATGPRIGVVHLGGQIGKQRLIIEGEPLSEAGSSYVLFLRTRGGDHYSIVGGPQGRYLISHGKLALVSKDYSEAPVPTILGGLRVSDFERGFGALLRSQRVVPHTSSRLTRQETLKKVQVRNKPKARPGQPPPTPPGH